MVPLHGLDVFRPRKTISQVLSAWYQTLPGPCSRACVLARSTSWRPALGPPGMGCPSGRHWAWAEMGTSIRPRPRAHELSKVNSVGTWNLWWKFHHPRWLLKNGNYPRISRHRLFCFLQQRVRTWNIPINYLQTRSRPGCSRNFLATLWLWLTYPWKIPYKWRFLAGKIIYKWAIFQSYVK